MRLILIILLFTLTLLAKAPYNSNYLIERGIDPNILNNIVTTTRQNVAYRMSIEHSIKSHNKVQNMHYFMIVDPYPSYGTELKVQIPEKELQNIGESNLKNILDELMGIQLYLQHGKLYDINSLKIIKSANKHTIISFKLKKNNIPRELCHLNSMTANVHIINSSLHSISIENDKPFDLRGIAVQHYKKVVLFKKVKTGGYLVSEESLLIQGEKENLPYIETINSTITEYWNKQKYKISFNNGLEKDTITLNNKDYKTISLELDRFFPLLGKEARKAGYDLPKPFGITLVNMFQNTTMHMTSFKINNIPYDFNKILNGDSVYKSITYAPLIRTDVWVLPFVSFSVLLGYTDTTTNVTLASDSGLTLPIIGDIIKPGAKLNLDPFKTNSLLYGVGSTVAGGFDNYFSTIDFQYIIAYTAEADVSIDMMIITPLVGYSFVDYGTRVFIGAQYQRLAQNITFNVDIPGSTDSISGQVGLKSEEWAGVVGVDYSFTRSWSTNILYSQGKDRTNAVLSISRRF